jgi:hypothetical protein
MTKKRAPYVPCAFRLEDRYIEIIDRWAEGLSKKLGRPVNRSEAVRFILEGYGRAEKGEPEIGDAALFDRANRRS